MEIYNSAIQIVHEIDCSTNVLVSYKIIIACSKGEEEKL